MTQPGVSTGVVAEEWAEVGEARAAIARGWLVSAGAGGDAGRGAPGGMRVGSVELEAHQVDAVERLRRVIAESGGALLADPVGTGKTYVALALAAEMERVVIVGPAVLGDMWTSALARCGVRARWVSFEGLSRGVAIDAGGVDLVIVDEGHHARTPGTRRFGALAELCQRARVLVLSATPVHNRAADVRALVSLWRGDAAHRMSDDELASVIVRRSGVDGPVGGGRRMPDVALPEWVRVADDGAVLEGLLAVPSPLPPSDGGGAEWLVTLGLARQWASSEGALRAAMGRRLGQCVALEAALEAGRHPGRRELRGWAYAEGAVQLAFPELVSAVVVPEAEGGVAALLAAVRGHAEGLRRVGGLLGARPDVDGERAVRLLEIVRRHPGERVVAFASYEATVASLYRRVSGRVPAALLTGRGGRVAGGELSRGAVLQRFAPRANGVVSVPVAERVELLLTTDLLSEGVNLQDASVVVHLDLPWTPARMAQRVGRVARLGSAAARVSVYVLSPPASAEGWVEAERRLRVKAGTAARAVGAVGVILPGVRIGDAPSAVEGWEEVRRVVRGWVRGGEGVTDRRGGGGPVIGRAGGLGPGGFLALVRRGERRELIASSGGEASVAPAAVLAAVRAVDAARGGDTRDAAAAIGAGVAAVAAMEAAVARWAAREGVALDVGLRSGAGGALRRRVLERIARVVRRAPRHVRAEVGVLAAAARSAAVAPYGAGAERVLGELAGAELGDVAWLRAIGAFGALHARSAVGAAARGGSVRVLAAVVDRA